MSRLWNVGTVTIVLLSEGSCKNMKQVLLCVSYKNEIGFIEQFKSAYIL